MAGWELFEEEGIKVLRLSRELDQEALAELQQALAPLLLTPGSRVIVDLASCHQVTSELLRFFVAAARRLETQGGGFALARPAPEVQRFLELSGVAHLCQVVPSLQEAFSAVRGEDWLQRLSQLVLELLTRAAARA